MDRLGAGPERTVAALGIEVENKQPPFVEGVGHCAEGPREFTGGPEVVQAVEQAGHEVDLFREMKVAHILAEEPGEPGGPAFLGGLFDHQGEASKPHVLQPLRAIASASVPVPQARSAIVRSAVPCLLTDARTRGRISVE